MANDRQAAPEKQLLKLIEGSEKDTSDFLEQARVKRGALSFLSFGGIFGRFSFLKRETQKRFSASHKISISFALVNRVLLTLVVAFFIYVISDTVASALSLMHLPNIVPQKEKIPSNFENKVSLLKEEGYYLQKVRSRDIFREDTRTYIGNQKNEVRPYEESGAVKNLSLVGISWSADPDVIIEDKSAQRTFFLKRGQTIGNNIKVEAVFKDKVILSYQGQEFELR